MANKKIKLQKDEQDPAMEEAVSLIFRGCSLARELEFNALNLDNIIHFHQPHLLARSCDEILCVFSAAKERLSGRERSPFTATEPQEAGLEELFRMDTCSHAMELAQMQLIPPSPLPSSSEMLVATGFGSSSSSTAKTGRRRDVMEKRTVRVAAPLIGNTELPPDDGFTWRKYGQKEILGARFPRGYFRCTHQKLYNCPAKKHVQRLDHDPHTYEVTYHGDHTCHMSTTAPSAPPPPPDFSGQNMAHLRPPSDGWLSMDHFVGPPSGSGSGGSGGCPAAVRHGKDVTEQFPMVDMTDVMFKSGTDGGNSMDSIFAAYVAEEYHHHKLEKDDKKK